MAAKGSGPEAPKQAPRKKSVGPTIDLTAREVETPPPGPPETPEASPEPSHHSAPVGPAWRRASFIVSGFVGAAVVALIAVALWFSGLMPGRDNGAAALRERIAGLEAQLRDLQNRPAPKPPAPDTKPIDALSARLGKVEQALAKPPPSDPAIAQQLAAAEKSIQSLGEKLTSLSQRVGAIDNSAAQALKRADAAEKSVAALQSSTKEAAANAPAGAAQADVEALQKRLAALEQTAQTAATRSDVDALAKRVASLEQAVKAAPTTHSDIEALQKRVTALEQAAQAAREHIAKNSGIDKAARLAVSAAVLRDAVMQGAPFEAELAAVKSLGADDKALAALTPFAASGLPDDKALARELSALMPAMLRESGAQAPATFLERLQANADKLVRIRPVNAPPGKAPADVLARIEIDAANAKIAAALADLAKLPEKTRAPAQAWIEKAKARQAALAAAQALAVDTARGLARQP